MKLGLQLTIIILALVGCGHGRPAKQNQSHDEQLRHSTKPPRYTLENDDIIEGLDEAREEMPTETPTILDTLRPAGWEGYAADCHQCIITICNEYTDSDWIPPIPDTCDDGDIIASAYETAGCMVTMIDDVNIENMSEAGIKSGIDNAIGSCPEGAEVTSIYSGHGVPLADDLGIVVRSGGVEGVASVFPSRALEAHLPEDGTVILDTCHAGATGIDGAVCAVDSKHETFGDLTQILALCIPEGISFEQCTANAVAIWAEVENIRGLPNNIRSAHISDNDAAEARPDLVLQPFVLPGFGADIQRSKAPNKPKPPLPPQLAPGNNLAPAPPAEVAKRLRIGAPPEISSPPVDRSRLYPQPIILNSGVDGQQAELNSQSAIAESFNWLGHSLQSRIDLGSSNRMSEFLSVSLGSARRPSRPILGPAAISIFPLRSYKTK